jgi:hypothetical protein
MTDEKEIGQLYSEFEYALSEVLAEKGYGQARRSTLFGAHANLRSHPDLDADRYAESVDRAFSIWGGPR